MQVNGVGVTTQQDSQPLAANNLDKDTFMKILVAQLRYQNPMNPQQDSQQMIDQITQFSILEQLTNLGEKMESLVSAGMAGTLGGMLGKEVSYLKDDGEVQTGVAEAVVFKEGTQYLVVDGTEIRPEALTSINLKEDAHA